MPVVLKIADKEHGQDVCITQVYIELCQTSKMEVFINTKPLRKIFNDTHRENVIQFKNLLKKTLADFDLFDVFIIQLRVQKEIE